MVSDLYRRMLAADHGDQHRADLMAKVWKPTPWMMSAFVGGLGENRERVMHDWCREQFGDECRPIHGRPGEWQFGSAVVYGWEWFGFSTEEQMHRFLERWRDEEWCAAEGRVATTAT